MLPIILNILKIIGIAILAMLAALMLLMLIVLFWPISYRAAGKYDDGGACIEGRASWFFGLVSINARYEIGKPFGVKARLLFVTIFDSLKKGSSIARLKKWIKRRKIRHQEPELKAAEYENSQSDERAHAGEKASADEKAPVDEKGSADRKVRESLKEDGLSAEGEPDDDAEDDAKDEGFFKKIKNFFENIIGFIANIKFTFHKIYVTIVKVRNNARHYRKLLQKESTKRAFGLCSKQLSRILKNISPKKYEAKLHLGFNDPAVMGNMLALWGMLYPFHLGRVDIIPEFESKILEGSFKLKGRISVYVFLWALWLFMTDKNIKKLRRQLDI